MKGKWDPMILGFFGCQGVGLGWESSPQMAQHFELDKMSMITLPETNMAPKNDGFQ